MVRKYIITSLCILFIWPSACTLKRDCTTHKNDLDTTVAKLVEFEKEHARITQQLSKLKSDYAQCRQEMGQLEAVYRHCLTELKIDSDNNEKKSYHQRYQELEKVNANLSNKINQLKIEIKKRDSIIEIQEDVIRVLDDTKKTIETNLKEQIAKKLFEIEATNDRLRMVIQDTILFNPGSMNINDKGKSVLQKIAASVKENPDQHIRVEGHTDNDLPKNAKFNNWELSAARAIAVIQYLEAAGLEPSKLSAVAFGANRPVATNDTETGRLQNRRIELVLYYTN